MRVTAVVHSPHRRACVAAHAATRSKTCFAVEATHITDRNDCHLQRTFKAANFIKTKLACARFGKAERKFAESEKQKAETLIVGTAAQ
jgi:hypothetical protein